MAAHEAMSDDASRMPSREAEYRNLVLNQRVESSNPFVSRSSWRSCGGEVRDIKGVPVYAGLDLSSVSDLTAFVMIGQTPFDRVWQVHPTFWLPSEVRLTSSFSELMSNLQGLTLNRPQNRLRREANPQDFLQTSWRLSADRGSPWKKLRRQRLA